MDEIELDHRINHLFNIDRSKINASPEQITRIEYFSKEITQLCDMSSEAAIQLILFSIHKWQEESVLDFSDGPNMSYIERIKHKARMFQLGKECIVQFVSSSHELDKIDRYIDRKMFQYLSKLREKDN